MIFRNYDNKTVCPLFGTYDIKNHNEKMLYLLLDENMAFTDADIKQAHRRLDL